MSRKRGLGRGLDALLGPTAADDVAAVAGVAPGSLPLDRLRPNRRQPRQRLDEASLEELTESIRAQGVVQPIVVTPAEDGSYTIVAGERRWRAAQRAGLEAVPVVVREVSGERELLELALVENLQRSDLNAVEEAEAYRILADDFQLSQQEIGARVGKNRTTIANSLRLLKLPPAVQELLRDGRLSAGQARPLLALGDEREQLRLAQRAVSEGLPARRLETMAASQTRGQKAKRVARSLDVHAAAAEERLTQHLQTRVEIRPRREGAGEVRLHYHSQEELMRLYDLLMETGKRR